MAKILRRAALSALTLIACSLSGFCADDGIHIPLSGSRINLDPTGVQDVQSLLVARQLHCQLLRMRGREAVPEAAEQVRFITPTQLQMTLKEGVHFTDGRPVRAQDVVATFELLKSSRLVLRNVFAWIDRVEAVDGKTVVFHLRKPIPSFLKFLGAPNYALMPEDFIARARTHPELWNNPVGCGKYRVNRWDDSKRLIELAPVGEGRPLFFHLGVAPPLSSDDLARYDVLDAVYAESVGNPKGFHEEDIFDPRQIYLNLNTTLPAWRDKKDRCKFFAAIDRAKVVESYGPRAEIPKSFFPRGVLGYSPDWAIPESSGPRTPLGRAFSLAFLEVSVPENKRSVYLKAVEPAAGPVKQFLIRDMKHFGTDFLRSGSDAIVVGLKSNYLDGYEFLTTFSEPNADTTGYGDRRLKERIIDSQQIEDPAQRAQSYRNIASEIARQCLALPMVAMPTRPALLRDGLVTPGFGEVPINEYDFSSAR